MDMVETMMFAGKTPWHGKGEYVGEENLPWDQACEKAGLDWEVGLMPIFTAREAGGFNQHNEAKAVIRSTDGMFYGVTQSIRGGHYIPTQNREAFQFMNDLLPSGAYFHTAGSLDEGRMVWALVEIPDQGFEVVKGDAVKAFILLAMSHEPGHAMKIIRTGVRVVCMNTLQVALGQARGGVTMDSFRHVNASPLISADKIKDAREQLDLNGVYMNLLQDQLTRMADSAFSDAQMYDFGISLLSPMHDPSLELKGRVKGQVDRLVELFNAGTGQLEFSSIRGTKWAALNAVTELVDHIGLVQVSEERRDDARLQAAWFGRGAQIKQQAYNLLVGAAA